MTCDEVRAALAAYVNGDLDDELRGPIDEHLSHCAGCRRELSVERVSAISVPILEYLENAAIPPDLSDSAPRLAYEPPITRVVHTIIEQAIRDSATEIRIEPEMHGVGIYYRIADVWHEEMALPKYIHAPLVWRLKNMGDLDPAQSEVSQAGQAPVQYEGRNVVLRVSCTPTEYGDTVVIGIKHTMEKRGDE